MDRCPAHRALILLACAFSFTHVLANLALLLPLALAKLVRLYRPGTLLSPRFNVFLRDASVLECGAVVIRQCCSILDFLLQRPEIAHLRARQDGVILPIACINNEPDCSVAALSLDIVTLCRARFCVTIVFE